MYHCDHHGNPISLSKLTITVRMECPFIRPEAAKPNAANSVTFKKTRSETLTITNPESPVRKWNKYFIANVRTENKVPDNTVSNNPLPSRSPAHAYRTARS